MNWSFPFSSVASLLSASIWWFFLLFFQVDEELRTYGPATELTGSTATVVLIKHGDLICANLGDSRAIASVSGMVKALSTDHNTSNAQERERVYSVGGTIKDNRYVTTGSIVASVFVCNWCCIVSVIWTRVVCIEINQTGIQFTFCVQSSFWVWHLPEIEEHYNSFHSSILGLFVLTFLPH